MTIPKKHQPLSVGALQSPSRKHRRVTQWNIDSTIAPGWYMATESQDGDIRVSGQPGAGETLEAFAARVRKGLWL